ncbi:RnfABCDGE type electron transport complex subunit C [Candidatus Izemoplasma sp. B36]|uniref:RnfABCDGE type electron transport complex subunit C n=1 Tax=Candidatus Izemoplasma sp. B36 TaxID=3242468 RepID=UPI003559046E
MIFQKTKGIHIEGRKGMSKNNPLVEYFDPEFVYIHLLQGNCPLKPVVEVGDIVKVGQVVAVREGFGAMSIHASISGEVTAVKKVWHSSGKMVNALEIKNDFKNILDESIKPTKDIESLSRQDLIEMMKNAGLSGLGGAGFPTYIKYQTKETIDTVIINAVECEPYLTCDYHFILTYPEKLLKGLTYMMKAADAEKGVIVYKNYNVKIKKVLTELLKDYKNIELFEVKDVYPAGWEKYIIERVTGKTYQNLPSEIGVIENNSTTAIIYSDIVEHNIPLISRPITITGEGIKNPTNFYCPIGTKVSELVEKCGGYVEGLDTKKANYIAGGPMTGNAIFIDDLIINDTLGAVIIKPIIEGLHPECLGCGKCAEVCPAYLTPTEIRDAFKNKDVDLIKQLNANKCVQCGLCSYVCPSHIEITDYVVRAKGLLRKGAK